MGIYNLDKIFNPKSIALVGASEKQGSVGSALMENLMEGGFKGRLSPVNPHHDRIHGHKAFDSLSSIDEPVDLAIVATPIDTVPSIVKEGAAKGVGGAIVLSAGGKETGTKGKQIEDQIRREARKAGLRIIGPNCLGIICPGNGLNASFAAHAPYPGNIAFLSQSGALCTGILDFSLEQRIGFHTFVSIGSMVDVDFGDLIDYLGNDPEVKSILLYVESLTSFRKFMSAARAVARLKPIIMLKAGRSKAGAEAAASHTGAMAGEDAVYDTAFKRAGIVRVTTIGELFDCAELLSKQPRPAGSGLAIVTNSGGPGVMAADSLADHQVAPAALEKDTVNKLDAFLPPYWSRGNPIDILGDATAQRYATALRVCTEAKEVDGVLVILNPQMMTDPAAVAQAVTEVAEGNRHPIFTAWMGGRDVQAGRQILNRREIPTYETPEQAIRAFLYLNEYSRNLRTLQEIPPKLSQDLHFDRERAEDIVVQGLKGGKTFLTEGRTKELLASYGLPVSETILATCLEDALRKARKIGYPVVMKICSPDITHKSDAGGVRLDIRSADEAVDAYESMMEQVARRHPEAQVLGVTLQSMIADPDVELLLGARKDPDFGPVVVFGMGGIYAEVLKDRALALPPLNRLLAAGLMQDTKVHSLLKGYRNRKAARLELLEEILIRLSQLVIDFPQIAELDINPLVIKNEQPCAVDARVLLEPSQVDSPHHLVISPYPTRYESHERTEEGLSVFLRPIKPEDADLFLELFDTLSPSSIYYRFFSPMKTLPRSLLARLTQIDYDREMALVALQEKEGREKLLGAARMVSDPDRREGEFSVLVGDPWQGKGVGARLLERCLCVAGDYGIETVWGMVLPDNVHMLELGRKLGFQITREQGASEYTLRVKTMDMCLGLGQA